MTTDPKREAFEDFISKQNWGVARRDDGSIVWLHLDICWAVWQAALTQPAGDEVRAEMAREVKRLADEFGKATVRVTASVTKETIENFTKAENALHASIEALASASPPDQEVMEMALCESQSLVLREGQLYTFTKVGDCEKCAEMSAASFAAYGEPPLAALQPPAEGAVGWVSVPREPTPEMLRAAVIYANGNAVYKNVTAEVLKIEESIYGEVYAAMIAAASPTPKDNRHE